MNTEPFYQFMQERERIRVRRELGQPWPWTDDPILRKFKFTNVKRAHDKTTRLLRKEFYEPHYGADREILLLNCALFRYFGTIEFARAVGWQSEFKPQYIIDTAHSRLQAKERVFTGAYIITNQGLKEAKEKVVVDIFLAGLWERVGLIVKTIETTGSWESATNALRQCRGFGGTGFMAKEVMLDTMFTSLWREQPYDLNTWCPAGPGARRGINVLMNRDINLNLREDVALNIMKMIFEERDRFWPQTYIDLELHDIQFQLCEFAKYRKVQLGLGRPRSLYRKPK